MTECTKCGDCCRVIPLGATKKRLQSMENGDVPFLLKHWRRISRQEAERRNPLIPDISGYYYYECDAFDAERNECSAHDSRPDVCRGFPWYGGFPAEQLETLAMFPRCSFWADVPVTLHPAYVQMGETRKAS